MISMDFVYIQVIGSIMKKTATNFLFLIAKFQLQLFLASSKFSLSSWLIGRKEQNVLIAKHAHHM